jgi:hypothetical protein
MTEGAMLEIGSQSVRKRGSRSIPTPPRSLGITRRRSTPMAFIQIYLRNANALDGNISLDHLVVTSGFTLAICPTKSVRPFGKEINPNWRSLQARSAVWLDRELGWQ